MTNAHPVCGCDKPLARVYGMFGHLSRLSGGVDDLTHDHWSPSLLLMCFGRFLPGWSVQGWCSGDTNCGCASDLFADVVSGWSWSLAPDGVSSKCIRSWAGRRKKKKPGSGSIWVCLRAFCPTLPPCSAVWAVSGCSSPPLWSPCAVSASYPLPGLLRTSWGTTTTSTTTTTRTLWASACCGTAQSLWITCTDATPSGDWANSQRSPPAPGR